MLIQRCNIWCFIDEKPPEGPYISVSIYEWARLAALDQKQFILISSVLLHVGGEII